MTPHEFQPRNPNYRETIAEKLKSQHFMHHCRMKLTSIEPGYTEAEVEIGDIHLQQNQFVHGGVTATLSDVVMGFAAFTLVAEGMGTVTVDLRISYLNPGVGKKLLAKGRVVKEGSMLSFCESEVWCFDAAGEGILIAKGSSTMAAISPGNKKIPHAR